MYSARAPPMNGDSNNALHSLNGRGRPRAASSMLSASCTSGQSGNATPAETFTVAMVRFAGASSD